MTVQEKLIRAKTLAGDLQKMEPIAFETLTPSMLPQEPGVYVISDRKSGETLYVGRTKNLRQRIYTNHLQGNRFNARLKKYLTEDPEMPSITDMEEAKAYLRSECAFRYVLIRDRRLRGQVEGLFAFLFDVRYIDEEH